MCLSTGMVVIGYYDLDFLPDDTDTDDEVLDMVIEEFILKDRERAEVTRENQGLDFGYYDY